MCCLKLDQAQSKCSVASSLFSKSGWIKTTASRLSYEVGVSGEKKVNGNWDIINKNGHITFHTDKPVNFNSLREVFPLNLNYIMTLLH